MYVVINLLKYFINYLILCANYFNNYLIVCIQSFLSFNEGADITYVEWLPEKLNTFIILNDYLINIKIIIHVY